MDKIEKKYLTPKEAAEYLGVTTFGLQRWRSEGRGPIYKKPSKKVILYAKTDLDDWIQECEYGTNWKSIGEIIKGE